jgi:hypothetical protein
MNTPEVRLPSPGGQPDFKPVGRRRYVYLILLVLAAMLAGAAAVWQYQRVAASDTKASAEQVSDLREVVKQREADVSFLRSQLDTSEGERAVDRAARLGLEEQLKALQDDVGQLHDRLAFYEQLLPAGPEGTISVRGLDLERVTQGLRYRILLMRSGRPGAAAFSGALQFLAQGVREGKDVTIVLSPLHSSDGQVAVAADAKKSEGDRIALSFDQYQRDQGVLAVPMDFVPVSITANVLEGNVVRASRTVKLPF